MLQTHKDYTESRVNAFVCDLTSDDLTKEIPPSSVDIVTMVFEWSYGLQCLHNMILEHELDQVIA